MSEFKNFEQLADAVTQSDTVMMVENFMRTLNDNRYLWDAEDIRQSFQGTVHAASKSIVFRSGRERDIAAAMGELKCFWRWEAGVAGDDLYSLVEWVMRKAGFTTLGRVMLTLLPPGARIGWHQDEGAYATHYDRVHLCIEGQRGDNLFYCGDEVFQPGVGELFWFNHKIRHSVHNNGTTNRSHLIVDGTSEKLRERRGLYFQRETYQEATQDIHPLLYKHWREIAHYQDIPLEPDWERYQDMDQRGLLRVYTARQGITMIGYAIFFIGRNMHYNFVQASQDILFVAIDHRKGRLGVNLIRYAEKRLKEEGVQVVIHHAKTTNSVGRLLEAMGYEEIDRLYIKRLT
jgi:hypothetical protein